MGTFGSVLCPRLGRTGVPHLGFLVLFSAHAVFFYIQCFIRPFGYMLKPLIELTNDNKWPSGEKTI